MSSSLVVPVVLLENVRIHSRADNLELCDVLGYQMCIPKGKYKSGDVCVYIPADTLLPAEWADKFGVRAFLKGKDKDRVGQIRLRGEPSFGLVADVPEGQSWKVGQNVAEFFSCRKYEPPIRPASGDQASHDAAIDPYFNTYTDIQNGRIFTQVFKEGEEVVAIEKIHGSNSRAGLLQSIGWVAGSHTTRKKHPVDDAGIPLPFPGDWMKSNLYWFPFYTPGVISLLSNLSDETGAKIVLLFGEIYGRSVQSLDYGIPKGKGFGYRAFDICVDGKYRDYDEFVGLCTRFGVEMAPLVYRGPFSLGKIKEVVEGKTLISGADHIREGVVVRPVHERIDPAVGRAILKYISTEYSLSKHKDADTTDV